MATETAPPEAAQAAPPAKFSRYRSVRRAQAQQQQQLDQLTAQQTPSGPPIPPVPDMPPVPSAEQQLPATAGVSRSMSRYHRRPTTSHAKPPPIRSNTDVPPLPPNPQIGSSAVRSRAQSSPQQASRVGSNNIHHRAPASPKPRAEVAPLVAQGGREPPRTARDEAKHVLHEEAERQRRMQEKLRAEKRARLEAEEAEKQKQEQLRKEEEAAAAAAERLRIQREAEEAEQLKRHQEDQERGKRLQKAESASRLKKREEEARKAQSASPPVSPPRHGGGFGLFHRKRKEDTPTSPESSTNNGRPRQTSDGKDRELDTIRPGGGGAVLGIDAPISAVNAGDRRVMVVCSKQHIYLPVTPTTTPLDLIKSASTVLTESIDVRTAVILESFQKVGLKRPLRNYEHVRDVMNSWDDDKQNDLIILDSVANDIRQEDLLASNVPTSRPEPFNCYIHYSSKPGKWSKRFVSLRSDGQLVISKSESAKGEENLCHLSDFDIYTPTERKFARIRPPKKYCYAVKSQLKSNIYVDESRFVHFFCTNDKGTAQAFSSNLHNWRSWYLRHVMGEGQKHKSPEAKAGAAKASPGSGDHNTTSHARNASVGSHYQLGSFAPLLDMDLFSKDQKDETYRPFPDDAPLPKLNSKAMHQRKMSTRAKAHPPLSYSLGTVTKDVQPQTSNRQNSLTQSSSSQDDGEVFASGGLLGRTYSHRQRALQEREQKPTGPFTEGASLVNSINHATNDTGLNRRSSVRSTHHRTSSDLQRSISTRAKPKPLVDLTPQYREPPQHARKGRGFIPEAGSGPLVENATSIEEAIKIPSSTDWRARPSTARHGAYGLGGHEQTRSLKGRGEALAAYAVNNHENVPEDTNNAFTGGGLLARAGFSQGNTPVGHGVMDGSKARGPMLDMREDPKFASGSLLAGVERLQGPGAPGNDREKRQSLDLR